MTTTKVVLVGANNPSIVRVIDRINKYNNDKILICGCIDNNAQKHGNYLLGHQVIGGLEELSRYPPEDFQVVNTIASSMSVRREITDELAAKGYEFCTLIDPSVELGYTKIGDGTIVYERALVQPNVSIGNHCIVSSQSGVAHDCIVGNFVFVGPNSYLCGRCKLSDGVFIGAASTVLPDTKIGAWSVIGAGALVTKSLPSRKTFVGAPARQKP